MKSVSHSKAMNGGCSLTNPFHHQHLLVHSADSVKCKAEDALCTYRRAGRTLSVCYLLFSILVATQLCGCISNVNVKHNLEYAQVNGKPLRLDIYSPRKPVGKLPVVVWIHGGSWNSGSKGFCPIGFMAAQNLAIVSIDYQLTGAATFPAQLYDCKGAVRWLRANAGKYDLDAEHIGIFGASAGGQLALLLADTANHAELEGDVGGNLKYAGGVQCVCAFYPPTDLNRLVSDPQTRTNANGDVAKLIGGAVAQNVDKAVAASPLTYVDARCAPVYLLHGSADKLVPPEQSEWFFEALSQAGVASHLEIVPNKGHGIIAPPAAAQEIFAFFDRYLRPVAEPSH